MVKKTGHPLVDAIALINIAGNITPRAWYKHICHETENGRQKVDLLAINILADIVCWYQPCFIWDESGENVIGCKTKFDGDLLRKTSSDFAKNFNVSPRQARNSMKTLENMGLIKIYLLTCTVDCYLVSNVMHIAIDPQKIHEITVN